MAAKRAIGKGKQVAEKAKLPPYFKETIAAGEASAAPPLGPKLGQRGIQIGPFCKQFNDQTSKIKPGVPIPTWIYTNRGIQIGPFCKQFNDQTSKIKPGVPIPTWIYTNPDRSITLECYNPPATYFLKMAAGIKKGARKGDEIAGKVTLKHIYEIAKIKAQDEPLHGIELQEVCKMMISIAHSCGIEVVRTLDPAEYRQFLDKRKEIIAEQDVELEQIRQAKLLRL